jgi:hypothetical protein
MTYLTESEVSRFRIPTTRMLVSTVILQMPRASHCPCQHSAGFRIVYKVLFLGIPSQLSAQSSADIRKMANRICTDSDVYGANRFLSCFDRIEEIPLMALAFDKMNLILADQRFQ